MITLKTVTVMYAEMSQELRFTIEINSRNLKSHLLSFIKRVKLQDKVTDIEIINFWDVTSCNLVDRQ